MFVYLQKSHYVTIGKKEGSRQEKEIFYPSTVEEVQFEGDYGVMKIGPWWVESKSNGHNKNYILSLDDTEDLEETFSSCSLQINGSYLQAEDLLDGYVLIKPGETIVFGDITRTENDTSEYQEWEYQFPTTDELITIISILN